MKISRVLENVAFRGDIIMDTEIEDLVYDSRRAAARTIFFCLPGTAVDGRRFAPDAYRRGARVFVAEQPVELPEDAQLILVENARVALARSSASFFGYPAERLRVIGVTGTKGKTTITQLLQGVLCEAGLPTGIIGTNGVHYGDTFRPTVNTTPESYELHKYFREMLESGMEAVAMEVSSQGIKMHRTEGIVFDTAVFTNLSPDHIGPGEHESFEEYLSCKAKLFTQCKNGLVNLDDEFAAQIVSRAACRILGYSLREDTDFTASRLERWKEPDALGMRFSCTAQGEEFSVSVPSPGRFSVYNALAVIGVCESLPVKRARVLEALKTAVVKGRTQIVPALPYCTVMIDYAHNELSLRSILSTLREYQPKRIVCLFGSVGGRTRLRREGLARAASRYADELVITSDNPDFEDPMQICRDIACHVEGVPYTIFPDREEAVRWAVSHAREGDVLLLAGKGHEKYQLIRGERIPFSEEDIVKKEAKRLAGRV